MICETRVGPTLQWALHGPGVYQVCGQTLERLPAGAYLCMTDNCGTPLFQQKHLELDELIDFPDSLSARILDEVDRFWSMGPRFAEYGFLHRRGYLFYGKQGGGKSSLIHQVVGKILAAGHVAFFCQYPGSFISCAQRFREVEPDRPIVCIFEDIDAIIKYYGDNDLLQWLDGNHQVNKAINLATTNYPEKLDRRIISRPRRFDRILRIDAPDERMRTAYFARKMPQQPAEERLRWVQLSEGLPFAALAELVISVKCLGNDLEETITLLKTIDSHSPSSSEFGTAVEESENGQQEMPF